MSYSRSITVDIAIPYSGSVSNKAGTMYYSGTARETVRFNVEVDTRAFDSSVDSCTHHVNALTESVVATEVAQVASIHKNADTVGQTIISGFFKTVRSELSQQMMQLKSSIDATLLHLNQLSKRCLDKRRQMETDYGRVAERYTKIFTELNKELENRVFELDKAVFHIEDECRDCSERSVSSGLAGDAAVASAENSRLQAILGATLAKRRALDTLRRARTFLERQVATKTLINNSLRDSGEAPSIYVPLCVVCSEGAGGKISAEVYQNPQMPTDDNRDIIAFMDARRWHPMPESEMNIIRKFYAHQVSGAITTDSPHDSRVRAYLNKFINENTISCV